jgi:hypothetical protein
MTRHFIPKFETLGLVALFVAIITILVALVSRTQVANAGQESQEPSAAGGSAGATMLAQQARQNTLLTANAESVSELEGKKADSTAADRAGLRFLPSVTYGTGGSGATSVVIADIKGDGKSDLLVANICTSDSSCASGTVGILLGNGDGTFQAAVAYESGGESSGGTTSLTVADLNGDSKLDIIVSNSCPGNGDTCPNGTVGVLLGNGDGTFQPAATYGSGGLYADSVAVADLNGDGVPDIVVGNFLTCGGGSSDCDKGLVGVMLGNGDGTFQPVMTYYSGGESATAVAIGDLNGDGIPDVVVTNCGGCGPSVVGILLGNGDGTFQPAVTYPAGTEPVSVAVADVNGDGKLDVVVGAFSGVGVLLGNGDGTFQPIVTYDPGAGANSVAVADVNGDGKPDLVLATGCAHHKCVYGDVGVLLGNGNGTFQSAITYRSNGHVTSSAEVADVNGDGTPDLIVSNACANEECLSATVGVLLGEKFSSNLSLTTSGSPSLVGQPVTFTATVSSKSGAISNGESVTFYDGLAEIGTGATSGGVSTFTTSTLATGTHHIKASYPGDGTFKPSSGKVKQVVEE